METMAKTILIVEDDFNIADLLRLYLEKDGYTVHVATDGGKGVELFRQVKPDLVLLDLMLPGAGWLGRAAQYPRRVSTARSSCSPPRARRRIRSLA